MDSLPKLEDRIVMLFDVDGVIANTPHEEAWKKAADEWRVLPASFDFTSFYASHVAGKPGDTGAYIILDKIKIGGKSYFEREGITDEHARIVNAQNFRKDLKQKHLDEMITAGHFSVFDDTARILIKARMNGVPVGVVSSSESAAAILKKIDAVRLARRLRLRKEDAYRAGIDYSATIRPTLYDLFDSRTLGAKTQWHDAKIEKIMHYCLAKGEIIEARRRIKGVDSEDVPYVIVFEDAPSGIKEISPFDFYCIGISRRSTSGVELASKRQLLEKGAKLAYAEAELKSMGYRELRHAIAGILPVAVKLV